LRILLILFLLNLNYIFANDTENRIIEIGQILPSEDEIGGCKTSIFEKQKRPSCNIKKSKKVVIAPIQISNKKSIDTTTKLKMLREEFKRYKESRERENQKILAQLKNIKKKFILYKINKDKNIKKIKNKLIKTQKELSRSRKKLASIQKSLKKKKYIEKKSNKNRSKVIKQKLEEIQIVKNLPWVEIVVEDGLDIYQLALKYYKDKKEYKQIYAANRHIIGKDLKIRDGMLLKIPMNKKFQEQPMFLNYN